MIKKASLIVSRLKDKKIDLSVAESCTGGMFSQNITSVSGASKIFTFGIITYSDQSKIKFLNVPSDIIRKYGAVSKECCFSMIEGLKKISKAKINIAITGIAGPKGGSKKKPVGLVYIGINKGKVFKIVKCLFKNQNREGVRKNSVRKSLELLEKFI
tara:strand:+ start:1562 stop:2032 length:471 start_codon:yes stop_codon:yes gene_type:complete